MWRLPATWRAPEPAGLLKLGRLLRFVANSAVIGFLTGAENVFEATTTVGASTRAAYAAAQRWLEETEVNQEIMERNYE